MKRLWKEILAVTLLIIPLFLLPTPALAVEAGSVPDWIWLPDSGGDKSAFEEFNEFEENIAEGEDASKEATIYDPLEPINRVIFIFNDKLYFWVLKPTAKGYARVVPERGRLGVKRFFSNLGFPVRFVNSALQMKPKSAGIELSRFTINTTVGILGFMDPAEKMGFEKQDEDFGQTLGYYGLGHGIYLTLPLVGPSSLRDAAGLTGDYYLEPETYVYRDDQGARIGIKTFNVVNDTSLNIDRYEKFVKDAFDPYTFVKDAYYQRRKKQVEE